MIESLLIFSRTGTSVKRSPELLATLLEGATAVVRAHPDAEHVALVTHCGDPAQTAIIADGKQIERAICNLLLNACQAVRSPGRAASVVMTLKVVEKYVIVSVTDNGQGVPESIRNSLFEPFVSEGKQKGTGLGLTLAHCVATEHGGEVVLISSRPGETIFQMRILREVAPSDAPDSPEAKSDNQVIQHANLQT
jgi:signal transduction histidine kinase